MEENLENIQETEDLKKELPLPLSEIEEAKEESNTEIKIVESAEDIDAPNYSNTTADNPTLSAEVVDATPENTSEEEFQNHISPSLKKLKDELDILKTAGNKSEIDSAMFTFEEVDYLYNIGITNNEKKAFVFYLQNLIGRKIKGGFDRNYGMPLYEIDKANQPYQLGQILTKGSEQAEEFYLLLQTLTSPKESEGEQPFYDLNPTTLFKLFYSLSSLTPAKTKLTSYGNNTSRATYSDNESEQYSMRFEANDFPYRSKKYNKSGKGVEEGEGYSYKLIGSNEEIEKTLTIDGDKFKENDIVYFDTDEILKAKGKDDRYTDGIEHDRYQSLDDKTIKTQLLNNNKTSDFKKHIPFNMWRNPEDDNSHKNWYEGIESMGYFGKSNEGNVIYPTILNKTENKPPNYKSVDAFGGLILALLQYGGYSQLNLVNKEYKVGNRHLFNRKDKDGVPFGAVPQVFYLINPTYLYDFINKINEKNPQSLTESPIYRQRLREKLKGKFYQDVELMESNGQLNTKGEKFKRISVDNLKAQQLQLLTTNIGDVYINYNQAFQILYFLDNLKILNQFKEPIAQGRMNYHILNKYAMYDFLTYSLNRDIEELSNTNNIQTDLPPEAVSLIESGDLFFDGSADINKQYQPKWVYESGNIYDKIGWFTSNQPILESKFGVDVLEKHKEVLLDAFSRQKEKMLKVDSKDEKMRVWLSPISTISEKFILNRFRSPSNKILSQVPVETIAGDNPLENLMNEYKSRYGDNNITKKQGLKTQFSLKEAFILWLREGDGVSGITYRNNQTIDDVYNYYLKGRIVQKPKDMEKAIFIKVKDYARQNGNRLFKIFLEYGLEPRDKIRLEFLWNRTYNGNVYPNLNKIPIGFEYKKFFGDKAVNDIRKEKLEAIRYYMARGSVCLAYGVGIGKTWCANFILAQMLDLGICNRPLISVPNQVYEQFGNEMAKVIGNKITQEDGTTTIGRYTFNPIYNGSEKYVKKLNEEGVKDETITICTYEGLVKMGLLPMIDTESDEPPTEEDKIFAQSVIKNYKIIDSRHPLEDISVGEVFADYPQLFGIKTKKITKQIGGDEETEIENTKVAQIFINKPTIDFDYITIDEAHNFKKLFASTKKKMYADGTEDRINNYAGIKSLEGGNPSSRAITLSFLIKYIQTKNKFGNTLLLTATPFTNSPLEVWTMLSYLNYDMMAQQDITQVSDFFDMYANVRSELQVTPTNELKRSNALVGWQNLISLQQFILNVIDKKGQDVEDKLVTRPNKVILPLKSVEVEGKTIQVSKKNRVSTTLTLSPLQQTLTKGIQNYAEGLLTTDELCNKESQNTTEFGKYKGKKVTSDDDDDGDIDMSSLEGATDIESKEETQRAVILKSLNFSRQLALSPYFYQCSGIKKKPTPTELVESSPKLLYIMECIKSVKKYHEEKGTEVSGQVVYMDIGTMAFDYYRDYLVNVIGYNLNEIGMITGSKANTKIGKTKKSKSEVANAFNGFRLLEDGKREQIADEDRVKVLIGSSSIKEGINLQEKASVLYNAYVDFNPTDNIQLEGRIWRQGNQFKNVRIVVPLMEDSADIFMFQKLQEKTERINEIWNTDGVTNEIDVDVFNPTEIKYDLIKDVKKLVKIFREQESQRLDELIGFAESNYNKMNNYRTIFDNYNKIYKVPTETTLFKITSNTLIGCYFILCVLRDDLLTKPLLKKGKSHLTIAQSIRDVYNDNKSDKVFYDNFNYTIQEMMELMAQFNSDKKIVYPIGYKEGWFELSADEMEQKMPLKKGDEVNYLQKLNRRQKRDNVVPIKKQGIIEEVRNKNDEIIEEVYAKLIKDTKKLIKYMQQDDDSEYQEERKIMQKEYRDWLKSYPTLEDYNRGRIKGDTNEEDIPPINYEYHMMGVKDIIGGEPSYDFTPHYAYIEDDEEEYESSDLNNFNKIVKTTLKEVKNDSTERKYLNFGTKKFLEETLKISVYQSCNLMETDNRFFGLKSWNDRAKQSWGESDDNYISMFPITKYPTLSSPIFDSDSEGFVVYNSLFVLFADELLMRYPKFTTFYEKSDETKYYTSVLKPLNKIRKLQQELLEKIKDDYSSSWSDKLISVESKQKATKGKWGSVILGMEEYGEKVDSGYWGGGFVRRVTRGYSSYDYYPFFNIAYPREVKDVHKDIDNILMKFSPPITNQQELNQKINSFSAEVEKIKQDKRDLYDDKFEAKWIKEEEKKRAKAFKKGFRTAGNVEVRALEFAEGNKEYKGNKYLDMLTDKAIEEKKGKKAKPPKVAKSSSESKKDIIETKIKRFKLLLKVSKGKKKKIVETKIKRFELLLKTL